MIFIGQFCGDGYIIARCQAFTLYSKSTGIFQAIQHFCNSDGIIYNVKIFSALIAELLCVAMFIRNHYRQGQVFLGAAQCHHTVAVYGIVQLLPIHDRHRWGKAFCQTNGTKVCRFTAIIAQPGLGTGFTGSICQCLHFRIDKAFSA